MGNLVASWSRRGLVLAAMALALGVPTALAGGAPSLAWLSSPSPNFGTVANGSSTTNTYTVKNSGGSATGAMKLSLSGASDFSISGDTCTATSLGPKKTCSVAITYAPTSDGANDTATLTVMGKKPSATAKLNLSGSTPAQYAQSRADCAAAGGIFSTDPSTDTFQDHGSGTAGFIWSCNGFDELELETVGSDCLADSGGGMFAGVSLAYPTDVASCYRPDA